MAEYRGIEYLRKKLNRKRSRVLRRYEFYEMKNIARDMGIATPPSLQWLQAVLGWNAKAVDSIADRLEFRGFRDDNFDMTGIFRMNNPDILYDSATLSALISSCCFIYISKGEDDFPRLQVIDGANATGIINPITNLLTEGYAVLERDDYGKATVEAYFVEGWTVIYRNGIPDQLFEENVPAPLLVPIIFRPDAKRAFGHSRISRACMSITESAMRTLKRSEITAEFYSFPQKYVVGLDPDAEQMDKWKATVSSLLQFDKDEDGDSPTLGQFQQQSMAPHLDQLKMFAALFAGETGLTLDDLGFATENPASQEAIKASHENLRLTARKAQRAFGSMSITESAMRTLKRSEITAEFYSFPQKYVVGLDPDAEQMDKWKATVSSLLQFDKDEDGDSPTLGQFQQQSMAPHLDQLKMFAALFAGETGLTLDDLGFATENPASQEAIKASHENLRLTARKAQRAFGSGFLNVGYLAACLRDDYQYYRNQVYMTTPIWEPVFEPDAAMLSNIGDGAIKINQAVPGYFNADNLRDLTGINMSNLPVTPEV